MKSINILHLLDLEDKLTNWLESKNIIKKVPNVSES